MTWLTGKQATEHLGLITVKTCVSHTWMGDLSSNWSHTGKSSLFHFCQILQLNNFYTSTRQIVKFTKFSKDSKIYWYFWWLCTWNMPMKFILNLYCWEYCAINIDCVGDMVFIMSAKMHGLFNDLWLCIFLSSDTKPSKVYLPDKICYRYAQSLCEQTTFWPLDIQCHDEIFLHW